MAAEKDARRDVKKTGLLIIGGGFAAIACIFLLVSWLNAPPPAASRISVDKTASGTGKTTAESPQYRSLLRENNAEGAKQAMANNTSFIASAGTGTVRQVPPISQEAPPPAPVLRQEESLPPPQRVQAQTLDPDRKKALEALLKELVAQRGAPAGQLASVTGQAPGQAALAGGAPGVSAASPFSGWTEASHRQRKSGMPQVQAEQPLTASLFLSAVVRAALLIQRLIRTTPDHRYWPTFRRGPMPAPR